MTSESSRDSESPVVTLPTPKQQSWGAVISIVIIVLMVIVGAFYSWGKRIAEENTLTGATSTEQTAL